MRKLFTSIAAFIVVFCTVSCSCSETASAQTKRDNKPYNLQKAWEVLQEDQDEAQAIKLLNEQLRSTPDNVEFWMLLCRIYRNREEYGSALSAVNEAIRQVAELEESEMGSITGGLGGIGGGFGF